MKRSLHNSLIALAAVVFVGGSFLLASGNIRVNSNSFLGSVIGAFFTNPSLTIVRDINSPVGTIAPGHPQTLAIFGIKSYAAQSTIFSLPIAVNTGDSNVNIIGFSLSYQSCIPNAAGVATTGSFGGLTCQSYTIAPSSIIRSGSVTNLIFTPRWTVLSNQVISTLTLSATPYYVNSTIAPVSNATISTKIVSGGVFTAVQCRAVSYGLNNMYGYSRCYPTQAAVDITGAQTTNLFLSHSYGYGYNINGISHAVPQISSIAPTSGNIDSGVVTITGNNFDSSAIVFFNAPTGVAIPTLTVSGGGTKLTFIVPKAVVPGTYSVSVANNGSAFSNTLSFTVTRGVVGIALPVINDLSPSIGPAGTRVVVTGTGLTGASIVFGGPALSVSATPVLSSPTSLTVYVPTSLAAGSYSVTAVSPNGSSNTGKYFTVTGSGTSVPATFYRLYNATNHHHFYTASVTEKNSALTTGFVLETLTAGSVYTTQASGTISLARYYNPTTGDHLYSVKASSTIASSLVGYRYENVAAYIFPTQVANTVPLYHVYFPNSHDSFLTKSSTERTAALSAGATDWGVEGYVLSSTVAQVSPTFTFVSSSAYATSLGAAGSTTIVTGSFVFTVKPNGSSMTAFAPNGSDFVVSIVGCTGSSTFSTITGAPICNTGSGEAAGMSKNVTVTPQDSPYADGGIYTVTLAFQIPNSGFTVPSGSSNLFSFYVRSIKWTMAGQTTIQNSGIESFKTNTISFTK